MKLLLSACLVVFAISTKIAIETENARLKKTNQVLLQTLQELAVGEGAPGIIPIMTQDLTYSMWRTATMAGWWKSPGDHVEKGEVVAELECYNVVLEILAPATGTLEEIVLDTSAYLNADGRKQGPAVVGKIKTVATERAVGKSRVMTSKTN